MAVMRKINVGLIGYGVVGDGVIKFLQKRQNYIRDKYRVEFVVRTICDRSIHRKDTRGLGSVKLTKKIADVLDDRSTEVVIELIGGLHPAKEIVTTALRRGKHVVTANKVLIAHYGKELFQLAKKQNRQLYFESSVGAGIPIIKTITEGMVGNTYNRIYGIINGTCNFILTEMTKNNLSFTKALKLAQEKGFAESNPTLDINGMDSTHKLAILVYLAFGKFVKVSDIYTEGITHISHDDIAYAESLNLTIKLLAIAKRYENIVEARVHPTLIPKSHPLASISGIYNAFYLNANPLGDVLLSGEGAGQMAAASGVVSDLLNLASRGADANLLCNLYSEAPNFRIRKIDQIKTRFYIRFMATDKTGVLGKITSVLGRYGIGLNSVTQPAHTAAWAVPVVMLTDYTLEKNVRLALKKIWELPIVKSKPVAIRMEKLW
ncbi:MAG: homoserine dehydrogenase [Candidatus Omnitrophica bacterium]|nr:homoserine dehydrogenase [Candidatus Omnitrophota bacterium]